MIKSIPKGINKVHVLKALADLDSQIAHDFGEARKWALVHDGHRYPPKAVIGLAARYAFGKALAPADFSSGDTAGKAVGYLRDLGFNVIRIDNGPKGVVVDSDHRGEQTEAQQDLVAGPRRFDVQDTGSVGQSKRLLVISCGERKRHDAIPLPALERYIGPKFGVLRNYLRDRRDPDLVIYILSAKFGLIPADELIPDYDQKMTSERAAVLRAPTASKLRSLVESLQPTELFVYAAAEYLAALQPLATFGRLLKLAEGNQGRKLAHLKRWLARGQPG